MLLSIDLCSLSTNELWYSVRTMMPLAFISKYVAAHSKNRFLAVTTNPSPVPPTPETWEHRNDQNTCALQHITQ